MSSDIAQLEEFGATTVHLVETGKRQLVANGVQAFDDFDKRASDVDQALRVLSASIQLLGFSVGVLSATYELRMAIMRLQFHFRKNAVSLYPDHVETSEQRDIDKIQPIMKINGELYEPALSPNSQEPHKPENILDGMRRLYESIINFVERVNEISEYQDEFLKKSFHSFANELKRRGEILSRFHDRLHSRAFKERVNKLSTGFGQHLTKMREALKEFQTTGVLTIQRSQDHAAGSLQVLSAVATFFSGVTASTIQYQLDQTTLS